jgi:hypothetical protein
MRKNIDGLPVYAIVVRGNEASEYYFNKIKPVWKSIGIDLRLFDATTPDTLPTQPLKFARNKTDKYTTIDPAGKEFTATEKAVWYSHYRLWWKSATENKQLVVVEHDCAPFDLSKLWYDEKDHFKSFDIGALGCYVIKPSFARMVLSHLKSTSISVGPLGYIYECARIENKKTPGKWSFIDASHEEWDPGCTQIIHTKFGTTIDHYAGTIAEGVKNVDKPWPYYVVIDSLPTPLTIDVMSKNKKLTQKLKRRLQLS